MKIPAISIAMLLFCFANAQNSQQPNLNKKLFIGAEIGTNTMQKYEIDNSKTSVQGGIFVEYYFAKNWSVLAKVKHHETGVSFYRPDTHTGGWLDLGSDAYFGNFRGNVITIPIYLKWEIGMIPNFKAHAKAALKNNFETKSSYENYSSNVHQNYPKYYASFCPSFGFSYFIDQKSAINFDFDYDLGTIKGTSSGLFGNTHYTNSAILVSVGYRYILK